jgi:hypothetical protein
MMNHFLFNLLLYKLKKFPRTNFEQKSNIKIVSDMFLFSCVCFLFVCFSLIEQDCVLVLIWVITVAFATVVVVVVAFLLPW